MSKLTDLWKRTWWFKIFTILILLGGVTGAVLQYGVGLNPNDGGTILLDEDITTLEANSTTLFSTSITHPINAIAFATDQEVDFYIFDFILDNASNLSTIANMSKYNGTGVKDFNAWTDFQASLTLVIITQPGESTQFALSMREYSENDMNQIGLFVTGYYIIRAIVWIVLIFVIGVYVVPWFRNRNKPDPMNIPV